MENRSETNQESIWSGLEKKHLSWIRILALIAFLAAFTNLALRSNYEYLDHDELQHAHAAWLISNHQTPYIDFFEHHPPHYWYFLTIYYQIFGDDVGVFYWGRAWMLIGFVITCWFVYLIGKEALGEIFGIAASLIYCLNRFAQDAAFPMRPDGLMIPMMMAGVYLFIRNWNRQFQRRDAIISGLLLGLAFSIHPRAGFTILGLAIAVAIGWSSRAGLQQIWQRKNELGLFTLAAIIPILVPFIVFGFQLYGFKVYVLSAKATLPYFDVQEILRDLVSRNFALFPLVFISIGVCLYQVIKDRRKNWFSGAVLFFTLLNLVAIAGSKAIPAKNTGISYSFTPPVHVLAVFIPTLALFTACAFNWIIEQLSPQKKLISIYLFIILGIASNLRAEYWSFPDGLSTSLNFIKNINILVPPNERFVGPTEMTPVFRMDGTYYWLTNFHLILIKEADPTFNHNFVAEFERTRPFLIRNDFYTRVSKYDPAQAALIKEYLDKNYHAIPESPSLLRRNQD